ncbi:hypothetical protein GGR20_003011 [Devosia subaequoris]|uniref:Uncharacterized protein n=1 Tax=Devosia subaequoris TaxID=395930 RepID=A0A7W6ND23_9HYPH|nr:hypothetical protein [Devosia subaequoris]MBB4053354.1 hypothetical protein [Devosia subaequoris]MCP1211512.1 hypothetical protein [Devosia subaequoris]
MALKIEGVLTGGVASKKTPGGSGRLEALHLALLSSHRLMRVLGRLLARRL